jgi:hypothetical protein
MSLRRSRVHLLAAGLLLAAAIFLALSGCSDDTEQSTTTMASDSSTSSSESTETTTSRTTDATNSMMTEWDLKLEDSANAQHLLALRLEETGVPEDDPQRAVLYGLKARINALSCLTALDRGYTEVADIAMREVYSAMNIGRTLATGSIAQTLADARAIVDTLGAPSDRPEEAAALLEEFVEALAPLVEQAIHMAGAPSTTATTTTSP